MSQHQVLLPSMGEGVTEATIVRWLKQKGEAVRADEAILEVATDKVDTEISAPADGFLIATHGEEGDVVEVDQLLAVIGASADSKVDGTVPPPPPAPKSESTLQDSAATKPSTPPAPPKIGVVSEQAASLRQSPMPKEYAGSVRCSPVVRNMARDAGIDLGQVPGSGLHGRITKADLEAWMSGASGGRIPQAKNGSDSKTPERLDPEAELFRLKTTKDGDQELLDGVPVERKPMSRMRKLIAEHMLKSVRVSPHVTTTFEVDLEAVSQARLKLGKEFLANQGFKLTFTPFFIYAAAQALKKFPDVNVSIDGTDILYRKKINIGCAVAIDSGLIVPVLEDVDGLNLVGVARGLNDLAVRARSNQLKPHEVQGGGFSITNPGMFGCLHSQPIISQPQVAIMSIGAIVKRPVVIDSMVGIRPLCQIGLTFDHRMVDGEGGAKFLASVKDCLENFDWIANIQG